MKNDLGNKPVYPSTEFSASHGFDGVSIKLKLMADYVSAILSNGAIDYIDLDGNTVLFDNEQLCEKAYDLANTTISTYQKYECKHHNQGTDQDGRKHCNDCGYSFD